VLAKGWKKKAYIIYPNGMMASSFLFLTIQRLPGSLLFRKNRKLKDEYWGVC
jgi:hypothetical protein